MAEARFLAEGDSIDYTPSGSAVALGQCVVVGEIVGVALRAIADGELGSLRVNGMHEVAKGAGVIAIGVVLYWDDTANVATTTASTNKRLGVCAAAALTGDTVVRVLVGR